MFRLGYRPLLALAAMAAAVLLVVSDADARGGRRGSLGRILQIGIVVLIGYLIWAWWQRRSQPALASGPALRNYDTGFGGQQPRYGFGGGGAAAATRASGTDEVGLTPDDFNGFERILGE